MPFRINGEWVSSKKSPSHSKKITIKKEKRKGRILTLVMNVNRDKIDLKDLLKDLKKQCHCGGCLDQDVLELQGDHEEQVKTILKQKELF